VIVPVRRQVVVVKLLQELVVCKVQISQQVRRLQVHLEPMVLEKLLQILYVYDFLGRAIPLDEVGTIFIKLI